MTDLSLRPHSLIENFSTLREVLDAFGPASLQAKRADAFAAFEAVGIPTTRDEEFKYVSLRELEATSYKPAYGATVTRDELEATLLGKVDAVTITFVNGQYAPELNSAASLPEGLFVGSLSDALETYGERIESVLGSVATLEGKLGSTNDERFTHLNTAYLSEGAVVFIPRGQVAELPIHIQFVTKGEHGPLATFPRTLVVLEAAAQAKIIESYVGLSGEAFTNAVTEIHLGQDAILEHTRVQLESSATIHISTNSVHQETQSTLIHTNVNFGGKIARHDVNVRIDGEHTETSLNGANIGTGAQVIDNHTRIDHAKPNCHSFETYKSILRDRAVGVFNGKIFVYLDAQKTDAKQTNQAILLSPTAVMNTKPQLEIFADDVKCTHGATIGQLREDALFYLRARGVPKAQAESLLVYAFAAEVLEKITVDEVREILEKALFDKLAETEPLPEGNIVG